MNWKIFFLAFAIALLLQGFRFTLLPQADMGMWGSQAMYVVSGNPTEFDSSLAYGHPGGPLIEGAIVTEALTGGSYTSALVVFMVVAESVLIGFICMLCYALRRHHTWWIVVLSILSLDRLYEYATPPSSFAALLAVLFFLGTWYMDENRAHVSWRFLLSWAVVAGLLVSTRADIGSVLTASFGLFLLVKGVIPLRKMLAAIAVAIAVFAFTDPFMWFIPLQHLQDIFIKNIFQYSDYPFAQTVSLDTLLTISGLAFTAMLIGSILLLTSTKVAPVLPRGLFTTLIVTTSALYLVFMTAAYQAPRYFLPLLFIWETLLPLYILALLPSANFSATSTGAKLRLHKRLEYMLIGLLMAYPVIFFAMSVWLSILMGQ